MGLTKDQRKSLADFCNNFAVAWLAGGLIGPFVTKARFEAAFQQSVASIALAGVLLAIMLYLTKGEKKK
jgi:hypothetical protein